MKVEIVYPDDGWILHRLANILIDGIPGAYGTPWRSQAGTDTNLSYFMHYRLFAHSNARLKGCFFPHKEAPDSVYDLTALMADFCVAPSKSSLEDCSVINSHAHLIYHGIDVERFKPRLKIGFVGREYPSGRKGSDLFSLLRSLDYVDFHATNGTLPEDEIPDFISSMDYIFIASKHEGGPLCFQEALAAGKQVISTNVGMVSDFRSAPGVHIFCRDDVSSLLAILRRELDKRLALRRTVETYTQDYFADAHRLLFSHYINPDSQECAELSSNSVRPIVNRYASEHDMTDIKLNLGCGGHHMEGWINVDNYDYESDDSSRSGATYDLKMDIRALDVEDRSVQRILIVHVLEHFVRWEAVEMLQHYFSKLCPGGLLMIEQPDLDACIDWYQKGSNAPHISTPLGSKNMGFTQFYGNQWDRLDYETHRYVWTKAELRETLESIGYKVLHLSNEAKFHQPGRDMWAIACKPSSSLSVRVGI
jgi:predicted SAM-dependent methyltransferase